MSFFSSFAFRSDRISSYCAILASISLRRFRSGLSRALSWSRSSEELGMPSFLPELCCPSRRLMLLLSSLMASVSRLTVRARSTTSRERLMLYSPFITMFGEVSSGGTRLCATTMSSDFSSETELRRVSFSEVSLSSSSRSRMHSFSSSWSSPNRGFSGEARRLMSMSSSVFSLSSRSRSCAIGEMSRIRVSFRSRISCVFRKLSMDWSRLSRSSASDSRLRSWLISCTRAMFFSLRSNTGP